MTGFNTPFQTQGSLRTPRMTLPLTSPDRSRASLAAEALCFVSKPEPHWADLFQETRRDLAADAARQAEFLRRMRSHSGRQISAARLAFNVARNAAAAGAQGRGEQAEPGD